MVLMRTVCILSRNTKKLTSTTAPISRNCPPSASESVQLWHQKNLFCTLMHTMQVWKPCHNYTA